MYIGTKGLKDEPYGLQKGLAVKFVAKKRAKKLFDHLTT